jgi:WD40 repeat protein
MSRPASLTRSWRCATVALAALAFAALPPAAIAQKKEKEREKEREMEREKERAAGLEKAVPIGAPLHHQGWVRGIAFTPDGGRVVTGSADRTVRVWDADTGKPAGEPLVNDHSVNCMALSPDGKTILVGCGNVPNTEGNARLWDLATGEPLATLPTKGPVWGVAFSGDGRRLLTGTYVPDEKISVAQLWEWEGKKPRVVRRIPHDNPIWTVALSPDGATAVTGGTDHKVRLWDTGSGHQVGSTITLPYRIMCVAFSEDGKRVLTACGEDKKGGEVCVWNGLTGKPVGDPIVYRDDICAATFSPNRKHVLTGGADGTARLYDGLQGRRLAEPIRYPGEILAVAYSPDGHTVAVGGSLPKSADTRNEEAGQAQLFRFPKK